MESGGLCCLELREEPLDAAQYVRLLVTEVVELGVDCREQQLQLVVFELEPVHASSLLRPRNASEPTSESRLS